MSELLCELVSYESSILLQHSSLILCFLLNDQNCEQLFCPRSKLVTTLDQQQTSLSYKFKAVKLDFET